jgi:glyoxylase-like metal-dependent hydrolase (beta-lactamase superfamily II)
MSWFTITPVVENVYRISEPFGVLEPRFGITSVNAYLVVGQARAALIDSGLGIRDICAEIRKITPLPCLVLNTHYHWDHVGGNVHFADSAIHEREVDLLAQEQDISPFRQAMHSPTARAILPPGFDATAYRVVPKPVRRILHEGDQVDLGGRTLGVLHVPGHSPGHVVYQDVESHVLFTGDTAYLGPVYACFEGSDVAAFASSVKRLAALRNVETICPGHNDVIADADWLSELAECVEAAIAGKVPGQVHTDFCVGRAFRFGDLSVWLPL